MKSPKKYLHELTPGQKGFHVKVKVIQKTRKLYSPTAKVDYQTIHMEDEQGNQMQTVLFNDDIAAYDDVIEEHREYDITNHVIKLVAEKRKKKEGECQISFNSSTVIELVGNPEKTDGPTFYSIGSIKTTANPEDRYNLLAVVLYIAPLKPVGASSSKPTFVREMVVTDNSAVRPLIISAWNDFAEKEAESLSKLVAEYPVIGFTGLKPARFKGFSLATCLSTHLIQEPKGAEADVLREWVKSNKELLESLQSQIMQTRVPSDEKKIITFSDLKAKKAKETMQEELHWLLVTIPEMDTRDVRLYLGCSSCARKTDQPKDSVYTCPDCKKEGCSPTPKMNFYFEAIDETGSYSFTAFTTDAEKILEKKASEIHDMTDDARYDYLHSQAPRLRKKFIKIQVGPATSLSKSQVLKWSLKSVATG